MNKSYRVAECGCEYQTIYAPNPQAAAEQYAVNCKPGKYRLTVRDHGDFNVTVSVKVEEATKDFFCHGVNNGLTIIYARSPSAAVQEYLAKNPNETVITVNNHLVYDVARTPVLRSSVQTKTVV